MTLRGFALMLTLCAVAGTPADAQRTGTRIDRNAGAAESVSFTDSASAIRVANSFGQCIARREPKRVKIALALPLYTPQQSRELKKATDHFDPCLGSSTEFDSVVTQGLIFAGNAAEWFLRTEYKDAPLGTLKGMDDDTLAKSAFAPRNGFEDLGLCVVRRNPEAVQSLILTDPTTEREKAAVQPLIADVGPCVPKGQEIKLNRPNLRALLSYALYRAVSNSGSEQ